MSSGFTCCPEIKSGLARASTTYLAASGRPRGRAYTDGSWIPPALFPMTMLATSYPCCVAGAGIVLSPDIEDWETVPCCCIEITDGESLGCHNTYMMEVLVAAVAAPFGA